MAASWHSSVLCSSCSLKPPAAAVVARPLPSIACLVVVVVVVVGLVPCGALPAPLLSDIEVDVCDACACCFVVSPEEEPAGAVMAANCGPEVTVDCRDGPAPLPVVTAATTEAALALAGRTGLELASAI